MPVDRKPLFRPEIVAARAAALANPACEESRGVLTRWATLLAAPGADALKESELLPDFLTDLFYRVLGYRGPAGSDERYTLSREKHVAVDGEFADAALGSFGTGTDRIVGVIEGKGPRDPLDRPFAGRRMSAIDQAYRYAINLRCDWVLTTNLREIRLHHKGHDQFTFERFEIARLATDPAALARFMFVLGAERVVPPDRPGHLDVLLRESERAGVELTRDYYTDYARIRRQILARLQQANPAVAPERLLFATQKLLDRVLFVAFAEDRGLLPADTLRKAFEHQDLYNPRSRWETFRGLFRAIDAGNPSLEIPAYNGGLFAPDAEIDSLEVPAEVFAELAHLGEYDYRPANAVESDSVRPLVDVEILGHIFEQSIADLEEIERDLAAGPLVPGEVSRRRRQGAFYTPRAVTRFIVDQALRRVLEERFAALRERHRDLATGSARQALEEPRAYDLASLNEQQTKTLVGLWEEWLATLETIRILDPACGSGAFLIEAFDQLYAVYREAADRLADLRGQRSLFDADRTILERNLFGVDLNEEAVQICRLSTWIKTAQRGKRLTDLDRSIRAGNSLVADPAVDPESAFDWQAAFPEVFADGGFDVVVGNPPYVRQELLGPLKTHLERTFRSYHGVADLYVYFFEQGLRLLKPGGRLAYVVTNKWLKAGYAEPLRRYLAAEARVETLVDLGHAKQVFPDADVFPSIAVLAKSRPGEEAPVPRVSVIPREQVRLDDLERQVREEGFDLPPSRFGAAPWALEPPQVDDLMARIRSRGVPLSDFAGSKPHYGIKTGLNEAFLVNTPTRDLLVADDPRSAEILKPYLRGEDVGRWRARWDGLWMIFARRGICIEDYPAVLHYLMPFRERLEPRPVSWEGASWPGRKAGNYRWFEIQDAVDYYERFERPKILWQEIQFFPSYSFDESGTYANNKVFFLPSADLWLLAVLNSPLLWWHNWRYLVHMKDEALTPAGYKMEQLPIAVPDEPTRLQTEERVRRLLVTADERSAQRGLLLDWLRVEHEVTEPTRRLADPFTLSSDEFVAEVRKVRGRKHPLTTAGLRTLRDEHARTIAPVALRLREAVACERELAQIVNRAYGLTAEEVDLIWKTAPPRMPAPPPSTSPE